MYTCNNLILGNHYSKWFNFNLKEIDIAIEKQLMEYCVILCRNENKMSKLVFIFIHEHLSVHNISSYAIILKLHKQSSTPRNIVNADKH